MVCPSQSPSLREIWEPLSRNFERDVFVIILGYIDESYSGEREPLTFVLSCVFTSGSEWFWINAAWDKVLAKKNAELAVAGRKTISRFHARDINSFIEEFAGWDDPERAEFTERLICHVFARHRMNSISYAINLKELGLLWPEVKDYTMAFAYDILLRKIMGDLAPAIPDVYGKAAQITLVHERCNYDGILLHAFNRWIRQKPDKANVFSTITPLGWQNCIPLQPADFVANESMKEVHRTRPGQKARNRRKSLSAFLALGGGGSKFFILDSKSILDMKKMVDDKTIARIKAEADAENGS